MNNFSKIIGYESLVEELKQIVDILKNKDVYTNLGVKAPKGLLLYGDPGVGKTLMATSLIEACGRESFTCRKDEPDGDFIRVIKNTFEEAIKKAPSIVFLDDMDKFTNGDERYRDAEAYVTVQSCIDSIGDSEVFLIATANTIKTLPDSLRRPGRFDKVIRVCNPRGEDVKEIVTHFIKSKKFVDNIDIKSISRMLNGRSCAILENIISDAGRYAGYERSNIITMDHFLRACLNNLYDVPIKALQEKETIRLTDPNSKLREIVYHEAGHATISEVLDPGSVTISSVYSRAQRSGGFTSYYHSNRYYDLLSNKKTILLSLGGMAGTEQKLGQRDSGSSNDLRKAYDYIKDCSTETGSCGISFLEGAYEPSNNLLFRQEAIITAELERYYFKAKEIIAANDDLFNAIAEALAEKRVLLTEDIRKIREQHPVVNVNI